MSILGAIFIVACGGSEISPPIAAPTNTVTPTVTPTLTPTPVATIIPTVVIPEETPGVSAAGVSRINALIPDYVPESHQAQYLICLEHPERFNRTDWIVSKDWPRPDAEYVADHEGGWDLCQFNTQGSGACGWFQILPCPQDGLTPEGQITAAYNKWLDGGGSFERHWFRFWK